MFPIVNMDTAFIRFFTTNSKIKCKRSTIEWAPNTKDIVAAYRGSKSPAKLSLIVKAHPQRRCLREELQATFTGEFSRYFSYAITVIHGKPLPPYQDEDPAEVAKIFVVNKYNEETREFTVRLVDNSKLLLQHPTTGGDVHFYYSISLQVDNREVVLIPALIVKRKRAKFDSFLCEQSYNFSTNTLSRSTPILIPTIPKNEKNPSVPPTPSKSKKRKGKAMDRATTKKQRTVLTAIHVPPPTILTFPTHPVPAFPIRMCPFIPVGCPLPPVIVPTVPPSPVPTPEERNILQPTSPEDTNSSFSSDDFFEVSQDPFHYNESGSQVTMDFLVPDEQNFPFGSSICPTLDINFSPAPSQSPPHPPSKVDEQVPFMDFRDFNWLELDEFQF